MSTRYNCGGKKTEDERIKWRKARQKRGNKSRGNNTHGTGDVTKGDKAGQAERREDRRRGKD